MNSSNELRSAFLEYFRSQGHVVLPGSPLVPRNDPTLLFTNAGMVQFKDVFLGLEASAGKRAATAQRCVRAGGKHNDLENVGYTARHHTFFEMLGNFSFGDYFKRDAIRFAWELLTGVYKLPVDRLWFTVYAEDDEAAQVWLNEIGVPADRLVRIGDNKGARFASDNFWMMGDTGPCGPCTEIFYDHGAHIAGGPPGSADADGDRYVEIWNLVFMQFNRDEQGVMHRLPNPSVDTGMGLERLAAVMQGVHSNYEIDLFRNLIGSIAAMAGAGADRNSMQVIADHIRSAAFLVTDGVLPSNEGRGYVLRRIIRRALRHGHKLGLNEPFFHKLVPVLERDMGAAYPELTRSAERVGQAIREEETRFAETLHHGMKHLEQVVAKLTSRTIPGKDVFVLYDTYGFPADLTADFARERGLSIDAVGFEREMAAQRDRARAASQFSMGGMDVAIAAEALTPIAADFAFSGYERVADSSIVRGIFVDGQSVDRIAAGTSAAIVLDHTPFYAESGGQVGDKGRLRGSGSAFDVYDTRKQNGTHLHFGAVRLGEIRVGDRIEAEVDDSLRQAIRLNHSATHLLHAALRSVLGEHVTQKGSLVSAERLRFDFSHHQAVTAEQLATIESMVNAEVRANRQVCTRLMPIQQAIDSGAMALFGEKYDDNVRVLSMGDFSVELCGGTHAARTGDIGLFKIVAEGGVAAGVRRIEAVTGAGAMAYVAESERLLRAISERLRGSRDNVLEKTEQLIDRSRQQDKEIQALKGKLASGTGGDLGSRAVDVAGVKVLAARLDGADSNALRETADQLRNKLGSAVLVLAAVEEDRVRLVAAVTRDLTARVKAGELVNAVAIQVGGKGGGRPDMAEAGGKDPANLDCALESVHDWVRTKLS
jgi:alanyl-tRNA synthetase